MRQEVKSPAPYRKKLFEWDREKRLLSMVRNRKKFMYELAEDNTFVCVAVLDKPEKDKTE